MTSFLVVAADVHTVAAACDYLQSRLTDGDSVVVLAAVDDASDVRDASDALNVAGVRLPDAETVRREGDSVDVVRDVAADRGVDEIVVGDRRGSGDDARAPGPTLVDLLAAVDRPVVVLPAAPA